jgi:hypothetical protein
MNEKTKKQMAKIIDTVQPHCDEKIVAAMTCSHGGAMRSVLIGGGLLGLGKKPSSLPNPVFIAIGSETIYAFKYIPKGFKFKINKEVARWSKDDLRVEVEKTKMMANFVMATASGEIHHLEVAAVLGAEALVDAFIKARQSLKPIRIIKFFETIKLGKSSASNLTT